MQGISLFEISKSIVQQYVQGDALDMLTDISISEDTQEIHAFAGKYLPKTTKERVIIKTREFLPYIEIILLTGLSVLILRFTSFETAYTNIFLIGPICAFLVPKTMWSLFRIEDRLVSFLFKDDLRWKLSGQISLGFLIIAFCGLIVYVTLIRGFMAWPIENPAFYRDLLFILYRLVEIPAVVILLWSVAKILSGFPSFVLTGICMWNAISVVELIRAYMGTTLSAPLILLSPSLICLVITVIFYCHYSKKLEKMRTSIRNIWEMKTQGGGRL